MTIPVEDLVIALPKGKLGEGALEILAQVGFPVEGVEVESRKLMHEFPNQRIKYLICRPTDIPIYVEYGAADIGIVGKDTLEESGADVFELADLGFGHCRFVIAVPQQEAERNRAEDGSFAMGNLNHVRVATKFPNITKNYFRSIGLQVEVIKLHGNIELAPRVGIADVIVDIVSTGRTLKENNLVAVQDMFEATARLIANRVSYRMKNTLIQDVAANIYDQSSKGVLL